MGLKGSFYQTFLALFAVAILATSCAPPKTQKLAATSDVTTCEIPSDQTLTLASRWRPTQGSTMTTIPVAFSNGQWDANEMSDINGAADVWNAFSGKHWGGSILDTGNGRTSSQAKPSNGSLCAGGIIANHIFTGKVNIYKESPWGSSNHSAIALTTFCTATDVGTQLPSQKKSYMAVMEVNYQDFFVDGKKLPDLKSIFIHEFGHLMGLGHSCEGGNTANAPNCNNGVPDSYLEAVMFPVVFFDTQGNGEQRLNLMSNDQGRANCLYGPNSVP